MNDITKEEKNKITENLKYIGLDLENIPDLIMEFKPIKFSPSKMYQEDKNKVYRYIPVRDIQIMITTSNRADLLKNKYNNAEPIYCYLVPEKEEDILKHSMFLKMVSNLQKDKIEQIALEQEKLQNNIPFEVKYSKNYLWQIFYSEDSKNYFMLVSLEELDTSSFFYLLKEQLKNSDKKVYVPVSNLEYSTEYLKKFEIQDIEKYLWLFTKDWPITYEVIDKENKKSLHFVGTSVVYEKIKSKYKIEVASKEDALKLYKLTKALFILQTELPQDYHFDVVINEKHGLDFLYDSKIIEYDVITKFIEKEYKKKQDEYYQITECLMQEEELLQKLKFVEKQTENEYKKKEREITTFLEYRKTFFGKIRYFFKKKRNKKEEEQENQENIKIEQEIEYKPLEKEHYTIEDLLGICKHYNKAKSKMQNIQLDKKALEYKVQSISMKLKNVIQYIEEIDKHKKSLLEFWKFANKDNVLGLQEGKEIVEEMKQKKMKKVFDYEEDFEEIGINIDREQRNKLSKEECDSVYIAATDLIENLNDLRQKKEKRETEKLEVLKKEVQEELLQEEEFDIFGSMSEDSTKIKVLGNQKHREKRKARGRILNISKYTSEEEYDESLKKVLENIEKALKKAKLITDISLYMAGEKVLNTEELAVFKINPKNALERINSEDKVNLYRINLKQGAPVIAFSNIIYYDNMNKTLPVGMNEGDKFLVDLSKYKLELKRQKLFRINQEIDEFYVNNKIVCVYEYDVNL